MAICPHCETPAEDVLAPCPSGDGYYCIAEEDYAAGRDDDLLGVAVGERFVVLGLLGTGSMAQVYRAHQLEVDRPVALKVFRADAILPGEPGGTSKEEAVRQSRSRFAQEARVLGKLAHPNCVTVYDFGSAVDGRYLYIAMEFVGGFSLRRAVNRGLKLDAILEIAHQVLLALREAHDLGIVHRDLKPENIILSFKYSTDEPVVKVVDFGIAKLLGRDRVESFTSFGALFGTPAYMSPEQCRGDVDAVGPHSDVYALGCILYEMVCGRLPYEATAPVRMIRMHTDDPVPAVVPRAGLDVPDALAELITKCMQKDPAKRFADAQEVLASLAEVGETSGGSRRAPRKTGKGRVVVPKDRVAGVELDPPTAPAQPHTAGDEDRASAVIVEPRGLGEASSAVLETAADPPSGGRDDAPRHSNVVTVVIVLAFVLLSIACALLFYFIWSSMNA